MEDEAKRHAGAAFEESTDGQGNEVSGEKRENRRRSALRFDEPMNHRYAILLKIAASNKHAESPGSASGWGKNKPCPTGQKAEAAEGGNRAKPIRASKRKGVKATAE